MRYTKGTPSLQAIMIALQENITQRNPEELKGTPRNLKESKELPRNLKESKETLRDLNFK